MLKQQQLSWNQNKSKRT